MYDFFPESIAAQLIRCAGDRLYHRGSLLESLHVYTLSMQVERVLEILLDQVSSCCHLLPVSSLPCTTTTMMSSSSSHSHGGGGVTRAHFLEYARRIHHEYLSPMIASLRSSSATSASSSLQQGLESLSLLMQLTHYFDVYHSILSSSTSVVVSDQEQERQLDDAIGIISRMNLLPLTSTSAAATSSSSPLSTLFLAYMVGSSSSSSSFSSSAPIPYIMRVFPFVLMSCMELYQRRFALCKKKKTTMKKNHINQHQQKTEEQEEEKWMVELRVRASALAALSHTFLQQNVLQEEVALKIAQMESSMTL